MYFAPMYSSFSFFANVDLSTTLPSFLLVLFSTICNHYTEKEDTFNSTYTGERTLHILCTYIQYNSQIEITVYARMLIAHRRKVPLANKFKSRHQETFEKTISRERYGWVWIEFYTSTRRNNFLPMLMVYIIVWSNNKFELQKCGMRSLKYFAT